jgi:excisionase family DNA binding protein
MGDPQPLHDVLAADPLLLTPEEAAEVLRVGRTTVYALMKAREIHAVHIGRSCRISRAELERYVRRLEAPPPSASSRPRRHRRATTNQRSLFELSADSVDGA